MDFHVVAENPGVLVHCGFTLCWGSRPPKDGQMQMEKTPLFVKDTCHFSSSSIQQDWSYDPIQVQVGVGNVISGWAAALQQLNIREDEV